MRLRAAQEFRTSTNALTKVVLAATSGPRSYLLRVLAGQVAVLSATWGGWLLRPT